MPVQHPHLQLALPLHLSEQLIAFSLPASHHESQLAVIGKAGIVFQTGNLQWAEGNLSRI
jgi:hypothetical protein